MQISWSSFSTSWKKSFILVGTWLLSIRVHLSLTSLDFIYWQFFLIWSMWPWTEVSCVDVFFAFLGVRSGKYRLFLAFIAHSSDGVGGKPNAARKESTRSVEANCWRFAWARLSLDEVNVGLLVHEARASAVGHLKAFRTVLLYFYNVHFSCCVLRENCHHMVFLKTIVLDLD